jgi:3-deoxy-7-phosphoheptulonate synthase
MLINMKPDATQKEITHVIERIKECGYQAHTIRGNERTVVGAVGTNGRGAELEALQALGSCGPEARSSTLARSGLARVTRR